MIRRTTASAIIFLAICLISTTSFALDQVWRVHDGRIIDVKQLIEEVKGANIIFVGEVHSNLNHHKDQLSIIKALRELKIPIALGLEMFRADSQKELDQWVEGGMSAGVFINVYNNNWGMPWPWYMNILKYARQFDIPLIGLNLPSEITERVARQGFESLSDGERKQLPPQISFDTDDQYRAHLRKAFEAHQNNTKTFDNFFKAQMIWNKTMAYHITTYLKANPRRTMVILAGTDHAEGMGIPAQVKKISAARIIVILPEIAGHIEKNATTIEDADYLLLE